MTGAIVAVDFGTSFTAVAVRRGREVRLIDFNGRSRMPSCVRWDPEREQVIAGQRAWIRRLTSPETFERTPKRLIDRPALLLGEGTVPIRELVAAVLGHALTEARPVLGGAPSEVRLTHPATWTAARIGVLRAAAQQALAGMDWDDIPMQLLAEPVAAAVEAAAAGDIAVGSAVAVYDLGGGTHDVAVVRRTDTGFEVVGTPDGRDPCGGEDFDARLLGELGRRLARDQPGWAQIVDPAAGDLGLLTARANLRDRIVQAKEGLSDHEYEDVFVPPPVNRDEQVTRAEFERLIRADVTDTVEVLFETVERAETVGGLGADELAAIVLTGGSSRIPLIERLVRERTDLPVFTQPDRKGVVAAGAARWSSTPITTIRPDSNGGHTGPRAGPTSEFHARLATRIDAGWRHRDAHITVGANELVVREYDCDLKTNDRWAEATRKSLPASTVMGRATPTRVAGVEDGLQVWLLESRDDGSATKWLQRFALRRNGDDARALHIVAQEAAAGLADQVRIGQPRLSSREYEHTPIALCVPDGKQAWERVSITPKRRLGRADLTVFAESTDLPAGTETAAWSRDVLGRLVDAEVDLVAGVQDTFLGGLPCMRHVVRHGTPLADSGVRWSCWWTGVVAGRGVAVAVGSGSEVSMKRAMPFRDTFALAGD
ncbi:MAG: hypothetical protein QOI98_2966 [Solirubrobacteraceae bacterium]|nr:hypothetical protein [Solirubrobacteraceae bacterium]